MKITKDEYILRNFSKIQHKKWELYVITRIIHLLNDPELEFVCQQLVKTPDNKRYLTDLCFPQLNLYCEIDELQHSSIKHSLSDDNRMKEIIDASDFLEKRIRIYDTELNVLDLSHINHDIDLLIKFIRERKKELSLSKKFVPWDFYNKYNPKKYINKGYLDINDNVSFLYVRDALKCFGYTGGHYQRAIWKVKGTEKSLWFPKLYKNKDWNNSLSDDSKKIEMRRSDNSSISYVGKYEWIVFAHYKNFLGQIVYKYLGEFHSSKELSTEHNLVLLRTKTLIDLKEYQTV